MNLRRKVIAASAAMLFTSTVGLGGLAIGITYQQGLSNVKNELDQLVALVEKEQDPLAAVGQLQCSGGGHRGFSYATLAGKKEKTRGVCQQRQVWVGHLGGFHCNSLAFMVSGTQASG